MNVPAIKKMDIINSLAHVPTGSLDSIKAYIDKIMAESNQSQADRRSLKGIWKDKGFEKIADLETELKAIRQELEQSTLERKF